MAGGSASIEAFDNIAMGRFEPASVPVVEVAEQVLADRAIVTIVRESTIVDQPAIGAIIASDLQGRGLRVFSLEGGQANLVCLQEVIAAALGVPPTAIGSGIAEQPRRILEMLTAADRGGRVAVIVDGAEHLSAVALCYLWLMIGLFDFGQTKLRLILIGGDPTWDGWEHASCSELRAAAVHYRIAGLHRNEAAVVPSGAELDIFRPASGVSAAWITWIRQRAARSPAKFAMSLAMLGIGLVAPTTMMHEIRRPDQVAFTAVTMPQAEPALNLPGSFEAARAAAAPPALLAVAPDEVAARVSAPPLLPAGTDADAAATAGDETAAAAALYDGRNRHRSPGLLLLVEAGDTLPGLYAKVYRGVRPPPYPEVVAANRGRFSIGAMIVFPAPPDGWK